MSKTRSTGRVSESAGLTLQNRGGIGFIARRGIGGDGQPNVLTSEGVLNLASRNPLQLLTLLPEIVPEVGLAVWNGDVLGCSPDSLRICVKTVPNAQGESEEAPEGTAAVNSLFQSLPEEVGDLNDCLGQNYQMALFSAMCAVECVPGPSGSGLKEVWPLDTLTLKFDRDDAGNLILVQRQSQAGYVPLPMERTFLSKLSGIPDNPYGSPPLAPSLNATLMLLSFLRDLSMGVHRMGSPKLVVKIDKDMEAQFAQDRLQLTDKDEIIDYVEQVMSDTVEFVNTLDVDDAFIVDIKSAIESVGAGDKFADLEAIYKIFRGRLIQALKQNPTLMGIVEGSTETWSVVEWDIYSRGLKKIVSKAAKPLVKAANLHLQLLGMPYVAEAEFAPIRSITRLQDAQAEAQEIENQVMLRDEGLIDQNTVAMKLTGSAPVSPTPVRDRTGNDANRNRQGNNGNNQGSTRN